MLVRGVRENRSRIDGLLTSYSEGWTLERMPSVDRNILRIGLYEVLYVDDVPDAVAVSEAIALARELLLKHARIAKSSKKKAAAGARA